MMNQYKCSNCHSSNLHQSKSSEHDVVCNDCHMTTDKVTALKAPWAYCGFDEVHVPQHDGAERIITRKQAKAEGIKLAPYKYFYTALKF